MADLNSKEEIEEELAFQEFLINTLDLDSDYYAQRLSEIAETKSQLRQRLRDLEHFGSQGGGSAGFSSGYNGALMAHDGAGDTGGRGRPEFPGGERVSSGSSSGGFVGHSMKRPRPDSEMLQDYPSKRNTPELSSAGTPSSRSSNDFPALDRYAENGRSLEQARRRQQAAEAAMARQRADEEMARRLSQQGSGAFPSASSSRLQPSTQTTLLGDGSFARPPPPVTKQERQASAYGKSNKYHIEPEAVHGQQHGLFNELHNGIQNGLQNGQHISQSTKPEPHPLAQQLPRSGTQVVDLTADESDDDVIAEIAPEQYTPSGRAMSSSLQLGRSLRAAEMYQQQQLPSFSQYNQSAPSQRQLMPGAYDQYPPTMIMDDRSVYSRPPPSTHRAPTPQLTASHILPGETPGQFLARLSGRAASTAYGAAASMVNRVPSMMNQMNGLINGSSAKPLALDDEDSDVEFAGYGARRPGGYSGLDDLYNSRYDAIHDHNPEKTRGEINALLDNIRPDDDVPDELLVHTPASMNVTLHKYQEVGLTWLSSSEEGQNKGGILGDDMGLGKTIQMISLMVTRKSSDPRCKTNLIVAPVALLRQWKQEIQTRIKPGRHALTVHVHHGQSKKKKFSDLAVYDVVLTTFGSLASELKKMEAFKMRQKLYPDVRPSEKERCVLIDPDCQWYRIILDEAQNIKNKGALCTKAACYASATYRWCMTGTPMMNNVDELFSLIRFLRIRPYNVWEAFRKDFTTPLKSGNDETRNRSMKMLQTLCVKLMLRRTKKSKFQGKPIISLPERTTEVDNPTFNEDEKALYTALETKTAVQFNRYLKAGTVGRSYTAILVLLLRLRQACCHPHLIKDFSVSEAAGVSIADMESLAKDLSEQVITRVKATDGNFECPICLDACTNPAIFVPCGHDTCRDCFVTLADPANATAVGEADGEGGVTVKCPHCRAKVDPKRITDFNSFRKVHMPETLTEAEKETIDGEKVDSETESEDSETESEGGDEDETLGGFIINDDVDMETESEAEDVKPTFREGLGGELSGGPEGRYNTKPPNGKRKKAKKAKKSEKGKGKENMKKETALTLAELKKLSTRNISARKKYLKKLRKDYISSAKIDKTVELLSTIMNDAPHPEHGPEKVLIFSQWTSLLDLVEVPIDEAGWGYRRYDGSMSSSSRGDAVDDFKDSRKNVRIMLVSLKAGNAGLNLNIASQVIILDPFWNPYIEEQAIDRAHRIGQLRAVRVHRVLVQETVEDRILALQEKKRALIETALDESEGKRISRLGVQELAYLFGVTRNANEVVNYQERRRQ